MWFDAPDDGGMSMDLFKTIGIAETISTISLFFFAMPMKYIGGDEIFVKIIGPMHGFLFIGYIVLLWLGQRNGKWNMNAAFKGMLLAIVPAGPIYFDKKIINQS